MARLWIVCDSLCVTFLILITFRTSYSLDDYYFYNIDNFNSKSNSYISLKLNENEHHIHKRQVQTTYDKKPSSTIPKKFTQLLADSTKKTMEEKVPPVAELPAWANQTPTEPPSMPMNKNITQSNVTAEVVVTSPTPPSSTMTPMTIVAKNNQTGGDDADISFSKFSDSASDFNRTLKDHNITTTKHDSHLYYNSSCKTDKTTGLYYWVNMTNGSDVKVNDLLSKSHRRAATVKLSFDFPFYGHIVRNVTIATGGFLYTGDYVHSWLAATQYIAPLMANFDTSLSDDSYIKYLDNGTAFTVLWEKVSLQDKPTEGDFTFQVTLHRTGDIVFVYQNVPVFIESIQDNHHPVKVGLSDAYIIDRTIFFVRRKTIYEYHRVNFRKEDIKNWTVIYLSALPTCPEVKDCETCLTKEILNFYCTWCPSINKCSNGLDRYRQEWLMKSCDKRQISNATECSQMYIPEIFDEHDHDLTYSHDDNGMGEDPMRASSRISHDSNILPADSVRMGMPGIVATLFIIAFVAGLGVWIMYAYRNPHTTSGQMLIRYRPSQWSWRRGEARYTAATIHM